LQIHTAHEFATANELFLAMAGLIESTPSLASHKARIRWGSGEQGIELKSGARLLYRSRTGGSGRGFAGASTIYLDEALFLQPKHMGALMPTMATAESKGLAPQVWYASSAGLAESAVLHRLRRRALDGSARLAYAEWTAEQVSLDDRGRVVSVRPDPADRDAWALANAALGTRITEEFIAGQLDALGPDEFLREHLGVWDAEPETLGDDRPLSLDAWMAQADEASRLTGEIVVGIGVALNGASASVGAAGRRADGLAHVEVIEGGVRSGTSWVPQFLGDVLRSPSVRVRAVAVEAAGHARTILPELEGVCERAGVKIHKLSSPDYQGACAAMVRAVDDGLVRHLGQAWLTSAVGGALRREVGDHWVWDLRAKAADVSPLVAVTVALRVLESFDVGFAVGFADLNDYV
jgi:hypothetical protein